MFIGNRMVLRLMEVALNLTAMFLGKVLRDTVIEKRLNWGHVAFARSPMSLSRCRFPSVSMGVAL